MTVKTPQEIQKMRDACAIVRDTLLLLESKTIPGITTYELDQIAYNYILSCGATPSFLGYNGYPASICVSIDQEVVHGIPSKNRVVSDGNLVSIDVGAYINGFHGDAARTFCMPNCAADKIRLAQVTKECFFKAIETLNSQSLLNDIGLNIQSHAEASGYSVVRDLVGHGIGKEMHEQPQVPNYYRREFKQKLKSGVTLAIEPMINAGTYQVKFLPDGWTVITQDNKPSAHYENTVLITDSGTEILTL